jgi:hypothetical protein
VPAGKFEKLPVVFVGTPATLIEKVFVPALPPPDTTLMVPLLSPAHVTFFGGFVVDTDIVRRVEGSEITTFLKQSLLPERIFTLYVPAVKPEISKFPGFTMINSGSFNLVQRYVAPLMKGAFAVPSLPPLHFTLEVV